MTPRRKEIASVPSAGVSKVSAYAWYVVTVLMLCYTLSFIDRQILTLLVAPIKRDLGISDTLVGLLQGLSFALFYAGMGLPLGRLVDSTNRRNLIAGGILLWSFFTSACAAAKSFVSLFFARMGVGVGEAALNPASFSILADYFPKERLGVALSMFYFGNLLGSSLANIVGGTAVQAVTRQPEVVVPILGSIASWRLTFLIVGLPGVLFSLLSLTVREPARSGMRRGAAKLSLAETWTEIRQRWQSVAGISLGMVCQAGCNYGFTAWAPTFFQRVHGWPIGQTGRALGMVILPFGCLGLFVGGQLSQRWQQRGIIDGPLRVAIPSGIGTAIFLTAAMLAPDPYWSLALIGPGLFFLVLPMGTAGAALNAIFPNQVRGQVSALYLFILNLGGLTLGPLLPGLFTDFLFRNPKMVGASVALTMAIGSLAMVAICWATMRPFRQHYQKAV